MSHFHTVLYSIRILWLCVFSAGDWEIHTWDLFFLVESFLCQCSATSYFTFTSAVLVHHTSKVAELCDWLQFFIIDHYSQLPALSPGHSHNFGLFHIYPPVVFLWCLSLLARHIFIVWFSIFLVVILNIYKSWVVLYMCLDTWSACWEGWAKRDSAGSWSCDAVWLTGRQWQSIHITGECCMCCLAYEK